MEGRVQIPSGSQIFPEFVFLHVLTFDICSFNMHFISSCYEELYIMRSMIFKKVLLAFYFTPFHKVLALSQ